VNILKIQHIINSLKDLGFTEYEARIYFALLRSHPSNGNTIATLSGVPTPKVYETLRKMQDREIVFPVAGGDKGNQIRYSPLPFEDLLTRTKKAILGNVSFLQDALSEISSMSDTNWTELFVIHGYSAAMEAVRSAITQSKTEIIMSLWSKELDELKEVLTDAYHRGVRIVSLTFDEGEINVPWRHFIHYPGEVVSLRHAGELNMVLDKEKTIIFQSLHDRPHAVVSSHPVTIKTTLNYIRHDIYVNRIVRDCWEVIEQRYGPELEHLINDF
jgi:sugar-specific transcriptional regulator TrmB